MSHRIPFFLACRLSVRQFQMPLEGLSLVKALETFGIMGVGRSIWHMGEYKFFRLFPSPPNFNQLFYTLHDL